jgi:threonine dehydratase
VRHGFATVNLTDDELAKEHVRHMVGGRSALAQDERLFASTSRSARAR